MQALPCGGDPSGLAEGLRGRAHERVRRLCFCRVSHRGAGTHGGVGVALGDAGVCGAWARKASFGGGPERKLGENWPKVSRKLAFGESPSWLRHRILIPACEGSNP